jgi:tetratricopeptide (TPR) repeat protein
MACLFVVASGAASAAAQDPTPSDEQNARSVELYEESVDEYRAGRFARAVDLLREAYRTYPHANLLYNLARAHEGAGDLEEAIAAYEAFLQASDEADDRAAIERRIDTLRYQIVERDELVEDHQKAIEALDRVEHERASPTVGPLPWLLGGAGLAAVATGTTLTALSLNDDDRAIELASLVTLLAGTALLTAAAAWLAAELGAGE